MPKLIKNNALAELSYQIIHAEDSLPAASTPFNYLFVCPELFAEAQATLAEQDAQTTNLALFLDSDTQLDTIATIIETADSIGINFPAFTDGRGYTLARSLREQCNYSGDIIALGDVLIDQLHAMQRCGFSSYFLAEGQNADLALTAFKDFSQKYQADLIEKRPIYQR